MSETIPFPSQHDRDVDIALNISREDRKANPSNRDPYATRPVAPRRRAEPETVEPPVSPKPKETYSLTKKGIATVAGLSMAAGAGLGIAGKEVYENISEKFEQETVAELMISIPQGGTVIGEVEDTVYTYFVDNDIDVSRLPTEDIVYGGQQAQSEYKATTGNEYVQPGALFEVDIAKNGFDSYSVNVSPVITDSPDVPETETN